MPLDSHQSPTRYLVDWDGPLHPLRADDVLLRGERRLFIAVVAQLLTI